MNLEHYFEENPDAVIWDGFDDAIIGFDTLGRAVYDIDLMTYILTTRDEMSEEDAIEYVEYNVLNAYVGEHTPIHIYPRLTDNENN